MASSTSRIVWAKPGRHAKTLQAFFERLGDRRRTITAISIDMSAGYENAICSYVTPGRHR